MMTLLYYSIPAFQKNYCKVLGPHARYSFAKINLSQFANETETTVYIGSVLVPTVILFAVNSNKSNTLLETSDFFMD